MKRCPTCNQVFAEEWLTFCTSDGTALTSTSTGDPPPTITLPQPPVTATQDERPTLRVGPDALFGGPGNSLQQQQRVAPVWQPPPPPQASASASPHSLAVLSLVLGIVSMTIGWCCYFGILTSPIAVGLGIFSLVQIKNKPTQFTGKPLAIGGIVTGALYFLIVALIILLYGLSFLLSGVR
jgi:hypothetical protein